MPLDVGSTAPDFCLDDAYHKRVCLRDYQGKWVILYFYPKDNTPGCTLEAIDFSFLKDEFEAAEAVILGVSSDTCESHQKFIDDKQLTIVLLSDPDASMQKDYGVWKPLKFMGKEYLGTVRTTYLINPQGTVVKIWPKVEVKGHAEDVLSQLRTAKGNS